MLVYLAAPYSDSDPRVVEYRIKTFCEVDAVLNNNGIYTVSPLFKHLVLQYSDLPSDWNYWQTYSENLLKRCDKMIIVTLDGWEDSVGVQAEIVLCKQLNIPIEYVNEFGE